MQNSRVEPRQGEDPRSYIVSKNINRRHLNKGQQALALAWIFPEGPGRGKRDPALERIRETRILSHDRLRDARAIIRHPDLVKMLKANENDLRLRRGRGPASARGNKEKKVRETRSFSHDRLGRARASFNRRLEKSAASADFIASDCRSGKTG